MFYRVISYFIIFYNVMLSYIFFTYLSIFCFNHYINMYIYIQYIHIITLYMCYRIRIELLIPRFHAVSVQKSRRCQVAVVRNLDDISSLSMSPSESKAFKTCCSRSTCQRCQFCLHQHSFYSYYVYS